MRCDCGRYRVQDPQVNLGNLHHEAHSAPECRYQDGERISQGRPKKAS
jgi:hypothetical protein